jgi:hypothetical protein
MTKIVAIAAVALLALVGVHTGGSATSEGAIFTALIRTVEDTNDMVITTKQLRDRHNDVVGWGNTVCTRLGNGSSQCSGTFILPRGKISVAGTRRNPTFFIFAITGGTGRYPGWGGSLVGHKIDGRELLIFEAVAP